MTHARMVTVEVRDEICRAGGIPILLGLMESISPATVDKKEVNFLSELLAICVKLTLLGSELLPPLPAHLFLKTLRGRVACVSCRVVCVVCLQTSTGAT
jgi:hypothetical protein